MAITYLDEKPKAKITYLDGKQKPPQAQTLWKVLGAEVTPQMEAGHPYLSAITKTGQDVTTAPAHFINQLLMNYPRYLAEKKGIIYPEAESGAGQILSKIAGGAGMITSPGGRVLTGLKALKYAPKAKLLSKLLKTAAGGAVAAGTYAQPMEQRLPSAGVGALLGTVSELAGQGITRGVKGVRGWKTKLAKGKISPEEQLARLKKRTVGMAKGKTEQVGIIEKRLPEQEQQIKRIYTPEQEKLKVTKARIEEASKQSSNIYKAKNAEATEKAKQELKTISELEAKQAKGSLQTFKKEHSKAYSKELDNIRSLSRQEINDIIESTKSDLKRKFIDTSDLDLLEEKYKIKPGRKPEKTFKFKEFKQDYDNLMERVSTKARGPAANVQRGDLPAIVFKNHLMEYAKENIPEFAVLQKKAAPVFQTINNLESKLEPGDVFKLRKGATFIRDIATKGKATSGELDLITMLEKGVPGYTRGTTAIAPKSIQAIESAAKVQKELSLALEKRITQLNSRMEKVAKGETALSESETRKMAKLVQDKAKLETQKKVIETAKQQRLGQLEERGKELSRIKSKQAAANKVMRTTVGVLTGGGLLSYLLRRKIAQKVFEQ